MLLYYPRECWDYCGSSGGPQASMYTASLGAGKNVSRTWTPKLLSAVQGSEGEVGRMEGVWRRQESTAAVGHGGKG